MINLIPRSVLIMAALSICVAASAMVTGIDITERTPYMNGESFGEVGAYEQLKGTIYFEVDPALEANSTIVDLELAPRNSGGRVEFSADLDMLAPVNLEKANGTVLYDVNNRGRTTAHIFNRGADGFLMRHGYIVVSSGWIAELLPGTGRLRLSAPVAVGKDGPITGLVRAEMAPSAAAERLNLTHISWSGESNAFAQHGSYEPTAHGIEAAILTRRLREKDRRVPIARAKFEMEVSWEDYGDDHDGEPSIELVLEGGFKPGYIYELIYEAKNPRVQGLGLAGIRDLMSCFKHNTSAANPLRLPNGTPAVTKTVGFGISQSGRCLRTFLHDGFNIDAEGRMAFDGLIPHVAGGGLGFFNHRFASPTRHNTQHDNHQYPADVFPFTYGDQTDPFTGRTDGILRSARATHTVPKIMHVQTAAEYWHRAGSLVHTDPLATRDVPIPPEVRIYSIGGAQHGSGSGKPQPATTGQLIRNPTDYTPVLRALLVRMDAWMRDGVEPPASRYPKISDGTLVGWREGESGWNAIPGVAYPTVIQQPDCWNYGPDYETRRRMTIHPPASRGRYEVGVAAVGPDNNERGMLLVPAVAVPVATYTGWNLRAKELGAETELLSLAGAYIPFAKTAEGRQAANDPRRALRERYAGFDDYQKKYEAYAREMIQEGYALQEDWDKLVELATMQRDFF